MDAFFDRLPHALLRINSRYFIVAGVAFILFYVILKNVLRHRKIQQKWPNRSEYFREIFTSLISMSIFGVMASLTFSVLTPFTQLYFDITERSNLYFWSSIIVMVFIHDTYFYWTHRFMHLPFIYRHVHLTHHRSTNPSPWTAYSFHPLEAVIEAGIIFVIAVLIPAHPLAIIIFFLFQIIYNVYGHLGFEIMPKTIYKWPILRWINTSIAHNQHHHHFTGNYGLYFLFWDRIMGTLRDDYETTFKALEDVDKNAYSK